MPNTTGKIALNGGLVIDVRETREARIGGGHAGSLASGRAETSAPIVRASTIEDLPAIVIVIIGRRVPTCVVVSTEKTGSISTGRLSGRYRRSL